MSDIDPDRLARLRRAAERVEWPHGKHAGEPLGDIPEAYRRWALDNLLNIKPETRAALAASLGIDPRDLPAPPPRTPRTTTPTRPRKRPSANLGTNPDARLDMSTGRVA